MTLVAMNSVLATFVSFQPLFEVAATIESISESECMIHKLMFLSLPLALFLIETSLMAPPSPYLLTHSFCLSLFETPSESSRAHL